ncbi:MAG: SDR family NAD(P)-dependent oxidoreductase [Gammaproteobacteria bacterium]|nr:SDR family NAD(P)-dependent oxidoreductase [Gammaproteobacteria bacterium]MCY4096472.1 SDR family NAD(P)-dependent oxidoreductase [Gammaproteobacteria bacterium]
MSKVAIVTGAGTGIGKYTTLALLEEGYSVALAGRRAAVLEEVVEESGASDRALAIATDVGNPQDVNLLFDRTLSKFGRLDLLFNNAGTGAPGVPMEELTLSQWQHVVDTNLTGAFLCTQAALKIMKYQSPRGGRIINNGSISAQVPRPNSAPYTATKHAITGLTKSTALDGRAFDVVCGQIDIGNAATDMTSRMTDGVPQADGSRKAEPTMHVDNVVRAVLYMDSLPLDANVQYLTVLASTMPFTGRG